MAVLLLLLLMMGPMSMPATGQEKSDSPMDLSVLKFSWNPHLYRPGWDEDLYRTANEAAQDERKDREAKRRPTPRPNDVMTLPEVKRDEQAEGSKGFQYRVTVKNGGRKIIRTVEWEYVFLHPGTGKEAMRHPFASKTRIKPGEKKELLHFSTAPPTPVIPIRGDGGQPAPTFLESVRITRVEYSDGSLWERR